MPVLTILQADILDFVEFLPISMCEIHQNQLFGACKIVKKAIIEFLKLSKTWFCGNSECQICWIQAYLILHLRNAKIGFA